MSTPTSSHDTSTTAGPGQQMSSLASLLISADNEQETSEPSNALETGTPATTTASSTRATRTEAESGMITPEEGSNITSSDAATVHSSASG